MSYEDMLEMFGPGHVPEKASVEAVTSLPIITMTDTELARLQRPDVQEGKDCLVCMVSPLEVSMPDRITLLLLCCGLPPASRYERLHLTRC